MNLNDIRSTLFANAFYPKNPEEIRKIIHKLEQNIQLPEISGKIYGAIVPHAGYIYSGYCALHIYKILEKEHNIKKIILIGPNHHHGIDYVMIQDYKEWETPFGNITVDKNILQSFIEQFEKNNIPYRFEKNTDEHSLEVQMPLLKYFLPDVKIIPFLCNNISLCKKISDIISNIINSSNDTIFIASSDLSHYHPEKIAHDIDKETIKNILNCDELKVLNDVTNRRGTCGGVGILSLVHTAKQLNLKTHLLNYNTSSDGGKFLDLKSPSSSVVGYSSIIFYRDL